MYYNITLKHELSNSNTYEHNLFGARNVVDRHQCHMAAKFGVFVDKDHSYFTTLYWLTKRHKNHVLLLILAHVLQLS